MSPRRNLHSLTAFALVLLMSVALASPPLPAAENPPAQSHKEAPRTPPPEIKLPAGNFTPKTIEELKALEAQVQKVAAKVLSCTVSVRTSTGGSGVIVSEDGLVLTAEHVARKPGQDVVFYFHDGKTAKGKTLGICSTADAGMMKITTPGKWPFAEPGQSAGLRPGTWCLAMGHPRGYQPGRPPVLRVGRILNSRQREGKIQSDCTLVGGDSGGPLFDLEGRVIGIHSQIGGPADMNLHVPIDVFKEYWDRLVKGDSWQEDIGGRDSSDMKAAFRPVVAEAGRCAVRIKCNGEDAALGTIVGPDGWILTKASELKGEVICLMRDNRELKARVVGIAPQYDLAMLKIDAMGLPVIPWTKTQPAVGQWLATAGPADDPLALGVLSVPPRRIPPISGVLGITMKIDDKLPATIDKVHPDSAAAKAGVKDGDVITHVNGKQIKDSGELIKTVRQLRPGDIVRLNVKRGNSTLTLSATLGTPGPKKRQTQNPTISRRHNDFPIVLQHASVVRPTDCGGPMVDLNGKVIGINIARGGRTETYCVPTEVLMGMMYDLMSGRMAPPDAAKPATKKAAAQETTRDEAEQENGAAEQRANA